MYTQINQTIGKEQFFKNVDNNQQKRLQLLLANQDFSIRSKFKILIVEDTPLIQRVHSLMLQRLGYNFDLAANGMEALNLLKGKYDLILLDIGLPDIDGINVCKQIRQMELYSYIPIIALTAYSRECVNEDCMKVGINEIAIKPIRMNELERILDKYLGKDAKKNTSK